MVHLQVKSSLASDYNEVLLENAVLTEPKIDGLRIVTPCMKVAGHARLPEAQGLREDVGGLGELGDLKVGYTTSCINVPQPWLFC